MRILCVAEKPSIANSITSILSCGGTVSKENGRDKFCKNNHFKYRLPPGHTIKLHSNIVQPGWIEITVTSVRGHVMSCDFGEQFKSWRSCSPADLFEAPIQITVSDDAKQIATNLRQQTNGADILMIWTDCDREGEHIGSEIVNICRKVKRSLPVLRAKFSAIIAEQIHRAMQHPVELDWNAVAAVDCRQELDLRLGVAFTRLQTVRLQSKFFELDKLVISYGPCQFPTLGFVVEQYCKVMEFEPETFWYIAVMKKRNDVEVDFRWSRNHLFVEQDVTTIFQRCINNPEATITKVTTKDTRKFKPHPLTTVELQKAGGRLLRMAPKTVLDIAEKLYQRGLLSYPRTETDQYDPAFDFRTYIDKQKNHPDWGSFASRLSENTDGRCFEKPVNGKKNDKAHPPIHPTKPAIDLNGNEKRVYEFVTRRFLASCSKHAVGKQTNVDLNIASETFSTNGIVVLERNYLDVYPYDSWGGPALPEFRQGERFQPDKIEKKEGETTRPKLLTEADLVSLMDKNGIGTDATIAEHIHKIIDRQYVMLQSEGQINYLVPSTLGMGLVSGYNKIVQRDEKSLCKPKLRRETEENMTLICEGTRTKEEIVRESLLEYLGVFKDVQERFKLLEDSMHDYLRGKEDDVSEEVVITDVETQARPPATEIRVTNTNSVNVPQNGQRNGNVEVIELEDDDDLDVSALVEASNEAERRQRVQSAQSTNVIERPIPNRTATNRISTEEEEEKVFCRCNEEAKQKIVIKEGINKGRPFWSCGKAQNDPQNCQFFQFADQYPLTRSNEGQSCFTCGQAGHWSAQCPQSSQRKRANGGTGSIGNNDNERRPAKRSNTGSCYKCGEPGHWSNDCPQQTHAQTSGTCYVCNETGHWASACPDQNADRRGHSSRRRGNGRGTVSSRR